MSAVAKPGMGSCAVGGLIRINGREGDYVLRRRGSLSAGAGWREDDGMWRHHERGGYRVGSL